MGHDEVSRRLQDHAEREAVRTTIVGGRPPGSGADVGAVPRGMEVLLKKSAVDAAFRAALLDRRAQAAADLGLLLTPGEQTMLRVVSRAQLAGMIDQTKVPPAAVPALRGQVAAVMLAALGLIQLTGCDQGVYSAGSRPATSSSPATQTNMPILEAPPLEEPRGPTKDSDRPMAVFGAVVRGPHQQPPATELWPPTTFTGDKMPEIISIGGEMADVPKRKPSTQPTTASTSQSQSATQPVPSEPISRGIRPDVPATTPQSQPATTSASQPATQGTFVLPPGSMDLHRSRRLMIAGVIVEIDGKELQPATTLQPAQTPGLVAAPLAMAEGWTTPVTWPTTWPKPSTRSPTGSPPAWDHTAPHFSGVADNGFARPSVTSLTGRVMITAGLSPLIQLPLPAPAMWDPPGPYFPGLLGREDSPIPTLPPTPEIPRATIGGIMPALPTRIQPPPAQPTSQTQPATTTSQPATQTQPASTQWMPPAVMPFESAPPKVVFGATIDIPHPAQSQPRVIFGITPEPQP